MFDPKTIKYPYPEETDGHYLKVKKNAGTVFDKDYPYVDRSASFRFRQGVIRLLLNCIVFPLARIRLGLRIKGRENLRKHGEIIKGGVISCSNHVHMWDYISIMLGVRPHRTNILSWAANLNGENRTLVRLTGGIPIPEGDISATKAYLKAIRDLLDDGGWLHINPEGSMWEYYAPIRPFHKGAAFIAALTEKPILPMAFSYREPGFVRRKIFHQIACFTLSIGEPIFADGSLPMKERRNDLTVRTHEAVCRLAGIDPKENIYPPLFCDSKRIDYYSSVYGVGYTGSR